MHPFNEIVRKRNAGNLHSNGNFAGIKKDEDSNLVLSGVK